MVYLTILAGFGYYAIPLGVMAFLIAYLEPSSYPFLGWKRHLQWVGLCLPGAICLGISVAIRPDWAQDIPYWLSLSMTLWFGYVSLLCFTLGGSTSRIFKYTLPMLALLSGGVFFSIVFKLTPLVG